MADSRDLTQRVLISVRAWSPPRSAEVPNDRYLVATLKPLTPEQLAFAVLQATGQADSERAVLGAKGTETQLDARLKPRISPFRSMFAARAGGSQDGFSATLDQTLFLKFGGTVRGMICASSRQPR